VIGECAVIVRGLCGNYFLDWPVMGEAALSC